LIRIRTKGLKQVVATTIVRGFEDFGMKEISKNR